jgi:protoporphyrinogen oxidase
MGTHWVRGRVPDAPVDDVLKAASGIPTLGYGHQAVFWYPASGGFESVIRGILAGLERTTVRCSTKVERVRRTSSGFTVNDEPFDRVVSTVPLPELVRVVDDVPEAVAAAASGTFVHVAHDRVHRPRRREGARPQLGVLPASRRRTSRIA